MKLHRIFKTFIVLIISITINHTIMAQKITINAIIGVYKLPNNNPEGGQTIAIFPDSTFVSVYFGGMQKGIWQLKDSTVYFTTVTEPQIAVYGRKLKMLKDSIQLDFSGEFNRRAKVNLNMETSDVMQHVFNDGANCKDYPYHYKTAKGFKKVSFALNDGIRTENSERFGRFTFNLYTYEIPEGYNDLLAVTLPTQYTTKHTFTAVYKNDGLYFSVDKPASKRPIESISKEDLAFYKKTSTHKLLPNVLKQGNEFFPYIEMNDYSKENEDELKALFQPLYIINPQDIVSIKEKNIKVASKSLFTANCD